MEWCKRIEEYQEKCRKRNVQETNEPVDILSAFDDFHRGVLDSCGPATEKSVSTKSASVSLSSRNLGLFGVGGDFMERYEFLEVSLYIDRNLQESACYKVNKVCSINALYS